jgi:hypothetical protein
VSRISLPQLLRDALIEKRDVNVRYTVTDGGAMWFHQVQVL